MYIVPPSEYGRLKPLISGLQDQGMANAVLMQARPGLVVANEEREPSALFIAAPEGSFAWAYLTGDPETSGFPTDLNRWLFAEHGMGQDVGFSFLVCDDRAWEPALATILRPRQVISDRRLHYSCHQPVAGWQAAIPEEYQIVPINQDLVDSGIPLPDKILEWFMSNFGSQELFLEHGLGSVALHEQKTVAWCLPDSVSSTRTDIGVETLEDHRRKGLAHCTTCQTLDQAFAKGLESVGWHCHVINTGSVKTAEKAGFSLQYEYPAYIIHFDEEKHAKLAKMVGDEIVGHATEALEAGDHAEAHRLFEQALGFSTHDKSSVYVLAARAAAQCEKTGIAFARLEQAAGLGWSPSSASSSPPEFKSLTSDPRWANLVVQSSNA